MRLYFMTTVSRLFPTGSPSLGVAGIDVIRAFSALMVCKSTDPDRFGHTLNLALQALKTFNFVKPVKALGSAASVRGML